MHYDALLTWKVKIAIKEPLSRFSIEENLRGAGCWFRCCFVWGPEYLCGQRVSDSDN